MDLFGSRADESGLLTMDDWTCCVVHCDSMPHPVELKLEDKSLFRYCCDQWAAK